MNGTGHNNPPSQIAFSHETVDALSAWMKDHPVISTEDEAREAKLLVDRGAACSKDMVDERQTRTAPLLREVEDIRAEYREPQNILDRVVTELHARLNSYIFKEEERRKAAAEEARLAAEEAERVARTLEAVEQTAKADAQQGILDVDLGAATREANAAFSRFKEAQTIAQRAERETVVKVGGGFRRATSLRKKETLEITNWQDAIKCMGMTDAIRDAILTEARAFRKAIGELPEGVSSIQTRG
jgi:hypothetical protein